MQKKEKIRQITSLAMMTALSVIIGIFCKSFLNFGAGLFRVTFENLPIIMAGIIFGPIAGGVVGLSSDLISYFLSAQAYPPNLIVTLGATVIGLTSGIISRYVVRKRGRAQIIASGTVAHILGSMVIKPIGLYQFYQMLVLWRIPMYMVIAPIEIGLICIMLKRKSFARVVGYDDFEGNEIEAVKRKAKMNIEEALEYIHSINWCFCKPGLERISELCNSLNNPQNNLKFIHVAGTNGKGSFCSMLSSILKEQGYRVGLYTSPYINCFNERMQINGEMISDSELIEITEKIKPLADNMKDKPTEFELVTAIAFEYFNKNKCDYVVLECGLGGRLDSTNVITTSVLSVITGIALDHTAILGNTIGEIAREKAGIIKDNVPCLYCENNDSALKEISVVAKEKNAPLHIHTHGGEIIKKSTLDGTIFDFGHYENVKINLLGMYQINNASNVLKAVELLKMYGIEISDKNIYSGMEKARWQARFEKINNDPLVIFDGAHNPDGVDNCVKSVKSYFNDERVMILTGVMADKDYCYIASQICQIAGKVFCITPNNARALRAEKYAEVYKDLGVDATGYASIYEALKIALKEAKEQNKALVCMGSLYMYSEVKNELEKIVSNA